MSDRVAELEMLITVNIDKARQALVDLGETLDKLGRGTGQSTSNATINAVKGAAEGLQQTLNDTLTLTEKVMAAAAASVDRNAVAVEAASLRLSTAQSRNAIAAANAVRAANRTVTDDAIQQSKLRMQLISEEEQAWRRQAETIRRVTEEAHRQATRETTGPSKSSLNNDDKHRLGLPWNQASGAGTGENQRENVLYALEAADVARKQAEIRRQEVVDTKQILKTTQDMLNEDMNILHVEAQRLEYLREAAAAGAALNRAVDAKGAIQEEQEYNRELAETIRLQQERRASALASMTPGGGGPPPPPNNPPNNPPGSGGFNPYVASGLINQFTGVVSGGGLQAAGTVAGAGIGALVGSAPGAALGGSIGGLIGSTAGQLTGVLGSAVSSVTDLIGGGLKQALDVVAAPFKLVGDLVGNAARGFLDFVGNVAQGVIQLGLAYIGVQSLEKVLHTLAEVTISFNSDLELSHNAWALILKDMRDGTDRAGALQTAIQQNAIQTSFTFEAVDRTVRQLGQGGLSTGEIFSGLLDAVQDVAASMGPNMLHAADRLSLALGQIKEAGHLTGEEMRQLRNAGVSIPEVFAVMARQTGITTGKLQEMQRAGTVTSDMFFKAFKEWSSSNFGGLAASQANTFAGAMEQIREAATVVASRGVKPAFDAMSQTIQGWAKIAMSPEVLGWAARFAGGLEAVLDGIGQLRAGFEVGLNNVVSIIQSAGQLAYKALQWFNPLARHSPSLVETVEDGVQRVLDAYQQLGRGIPDSLEPAANAMRAFRALTEAGLAKLDAAQFEHMARDLASIGPSAPAAYREVQLAIRGLKEDAEALNPEIITQTALVTGLKDQQREASAAVAEWTANLKEAQDKLIPYNEEIKAHNMAILDIDIQLLQANREYKEFLATLQAGRESITAHEQAVKTAGEAVDYWQIQLRKGEMGLTALKDASTDAQTHLTDLQEVLNRSRDSLTGVNEELSRAKEGLKDILQTPIQGTAKFADQIADAETKIARIEMTIAQARAGGRNDASLKSMNSQLAIARAHLDAIQAKKRVDIDIPEARLRTLAQGTTSEISFEAKTSGIEEARAKIDPLEAQVKSIQDRVLAQQGAVRGAQEEANTAKEHLSDANKLLDSIRNRVREAQNAKDQAELELAAVKLTYENDLKMGKEINDRIILLKDARDARVEARDAAKLEMEYVQQTDIQPIVDRLEEEKRKRDDINTQLSDAKNDLADMVGAQQALVNLAKSWQSEIDDASRRAKEFVTNSKADERDDAKKGVGDNDAPRESGADTVLAKFAAMRKKLTDDQATAKREFAVWLGSFQTDFTAAFPWFSGFFERIGGLITGVSNALIAAVNDDFPKAKQLLWSALKDVADGLPTQLSDWQWAFLDWVRGTGLALLGKDGLGGMVDNMLKFITGQGDGEATGDIQKGVALWAEEFRKWVIPTAADVLKQLEAMGEQLNTWVTDEAPIYKTSIETWVAQFKGWIKPMWDPMSKLLFDEILTPMGEWIKNKAGAIATFVLSNWVNPFFNWVFKDENGAWAKLRPELQKLLKEILDWVQGKNGADTDPLRQAGIELVTIMAQGMFSIIGTVAKDLAFRFVADIIHYIAEQIPTLKASMASVDALVKADEANQRTIKEQEGRKAYFNPPPGSMQGQGGATRDQQGLGSPSLDLINDIVNGRQQPGPPPPPDPGQASIDLLNNIVNGVEGSGFEEAGDEAASLFEKGWNDHMQIASPSKLFQEIGAKQAQGLNLGMASGLGEFKRVAQQYEQAINPFNGKGEYFSHAAGQTVRGGFSLTGARKIEDEPWYQKWMAQQEALNPKPTKPGPVAVDPGKAAMWGGTADPKYSPMEFPGNVPATDMLPAGDPQQRHTFGYDTPGAGEPDNVTLVFNQNGIMVGTNGMDEFAQANVRALSRDARFRRIFPR